MKGKCAVLLGIFLAVAAPAQAATYKIHWLLGHNNLDFFEEAALSFKKAVESGSRGDISVDIKTQQPDSGTGNAVQSPAEIADKVAKGEAEMGHSFADVLGAVDPRMYAFDAPYLFRGYRHLEGVFEGPLGPELLGGLREHGIVGLSFTYSGGANGIATSGRELRRPEDLKDLRIGVFGDSVNDAWLNHLGAKTVAIGHDLDKILPLAGDGKLDAVVTTWRNFDREDLSKQFTHLSMPGSTYLVSVTYINPKFYDSLPEKYRELIRSACQEASRIERRKTIELNEQAKRSMIEDRGIQAVYLSQQNQRRFANALEGAYPAVERIVGKELVARIRSTPDAAEHPAIKSHLAAN